jgi:Tfp pilus assembly protein FimV
MLFDRRIKFIFSLLLAMLVLPSAHAVSIGEVQVQSRWGEPLRAQVELRVNAGELIEESCLSLTAPDAQDDDVLVYLTRAVLGIKREAGRQIVTINTSQPFKEMFAKIRLQVKCANSGGMTKVLTILPDLEAAESVAVSDINLPVTQLARYHASG